MKEPRSPKQGRLKPIRTGAYPGGSEMIDIPLNIINGPGRNRGKEKVLLYHLGPARGGGGKKREGD